jgi:hypothetical protein
MNVISVAELLIEKIKTDYKDDIALVIGNPVEHLYRKLGFVAVPKFTDMKYKK